MEKMEESFSHWGAVVFIGMFGPYVCGGLLGLLSMGFEHMSRDWEKDPGFPFSEVPFRGTLVYLILALLLMNWTHRALRWAEKPPRKGE